MLIELTHMGDQTPLNPVTPINLSPRKLKQQIVDELYEKQEKEIQNRPRPSYGAGIDMDYLVFYGAQYHKQNGKFIIKN